LIKNSILTRALLTCALIGGFGLFKLELKNTLDWLIGLTTDENAVSENPIFRFCFGLWKL